MEQSQASGSSNINNLKKKKPKKQKTRSLLEKLMYSEDNEEPNNEKETAKNKDKSGMIV